MTIAEAIRILEQSCPKRPQKLWSIKRKEAVKMAIEALNFVSEHHQSNIETYAHDMGVSLEQAERELRVEELSCSEEPNRSDLISRTRLLTDLQETVEAWSKYPVMEEEIKGVEIAIGYVKNIPSANPDLSGYSDRLWKSAYDRGYARCKDDVIEALIEKGQASKRYSLSEEWELNYTEICDVIEDLPSAQPDLSDDGTLMMTVPHGILSDVKRVLVDEVGTKFCKTMYQDEPERKKGEWIPTKIAKPPKAGQYLVTKQQKTGVCQIATAYYNPSFDEWSGNGNFTKVLAWQQLPTPYTQE